MNLSQVHEPMQLSANSGYLFRYLKRDKINIYF